MISTKLGMKNRGLKPIIDCTNDNPGLTLTYFTARSNFVWENVTVCFFLYFFAACDLEVG